MNFVVPVVFEQLEVEQSVHLMTEYEHRMLAFSQAFLPSIEHQQRLLMMRSSMEPVRKISTVEEVVALAKLSMVIQQSEQVQSISVWP